MTEYKSDLFFGSLTGNGRVLVVDDDAAVRRVVRLMLERAGYEVIEAEEGRAAITAINTGENHVMLDVVICDIRMSQINGLEAIDYFQGAFPHVPIIVLTGFPDPEMAVSFMHEGVTDYLVKPIDGGRLVAAVARAMEHRALAWR